MIRDIVIFTSGAIVGAAVPIGIGWLIEELKDLFEEM